MISPDSYFPNVAQLAARYRRADNTLFVPEANNATNPQGAANAFYTFGELDSLGFSPFSHQGRHIRLPPGTPQIQRVKFYRYR